MVFHWSLSDSKSPQISRTLLSILAVLNNVVVWMVSTRPPSSKSSSPFSNPFVTVPNAPITIGMIVTCMFHSFFSIPKQGRGTYPSFHILSVLFCGQPGQQSRQFCKFSFFFFCCWLLLGLIFWTRLGDPCVCQSPIGVYVLFSRTSAGLCIMAIMNSKGDWASLRKIPLWIFASAKLLPPAVNSTLQVFMVLSIKIMTSCDILYILRQFIIQLCGTISYAFYNHSSWWSFTGIWMRVSLFRLLDFSQYSGQS